MKLRKSIIIKNFIIFTCIILFCTFYVERSLDIPSDKDYLKDNYSGIYLRNAQDISDLNVLDNDIKEKEIFLTGETHANSANCKLKMKFLKYFKEKTNFKYLLCEYSYSEACYLNDYLKSGDVAILENIFKPIKGTFFGIQTIMIFGRNYINIIKNYLRIRKLR